MHLVVGRPSGLDDENEPTDLGLEPADIIFISAADSELATIHDAATKSELDVAIVNQLHLNHPFSVDLFIEKTARYSKIILVRLLGGQAYWPYGVEQLVACSRGYGVKLILLSGDGKHDENLQQQSNVEIEDYEKLLSYLQEGGEENSERLIDYCGYLLNKNEQPLSALKIEPAAIYYQQKTYDINQYHSLFSADQQAFIPIVFYRALWQGGSLDPIDKLAEALKKQGLTPLPIFITSLKDPACQIILENIFKYFQPSIVINTTGFALSKTGAVDEDAQTALDGGKRIVLQAVLSGRSEEAWQQDTRGLSARDLAMHVVLPEIDGRILTRVISVKETQYTYNGDPKGFTIYKGLQNRIDYLAKLTANWHDLYSKQNKDKSICLILANYPNRDGRLANGVGLDTPQSCIEILNALKKHGFNLEAYPQTSDALMDMFKKGKTNALKDRQNRQATIGLSIQDYLEYFSAIPQKTQDEVMQRWGAPEEDPFIENNVFQLAIHQFGHITLCIQPARGYNIDPEQSYHDPDLVPPHNYFATYFWLKYKAKCDAAIHVGKHGNLEWLPGKAIGLSETCYPEAILGAIPNFYPFIVNDPGEGTQAKRRMHSVIIDHMTPPLTRAETYGDLSELENLVDEFYLADGLDPRRGQVLAQNIVDASDRLGLSQDANIADKQDLYERLQGIDNHLCTIKELQIRNGLHIFGQNPNAEGQTDLAIALLRIGRGEGVQDQSILKALCLDLNIDDFDPLTENLAQPYSGFKPEALQNLSQDAWRTAGDTIERIELLASHLIEDTYTCHSSWKNTKALLNYYNHDLAPMLNQIGAKEIDALIRGLAGKHVMAGPSGAPSRGRLDVLPTGRNFYSVDTRSVPTQTAWKLGQKSAELLVERYVSDEGQWPTHMALTAWGTSNMRTGGDDIAQALALMGVKPVWEPKSGRVTGVKLIDITELARPRVDVTLRISGFFRDAFASMMTIYESAVKLVAEADEPKENNPMRARILERKNALMSQGVDEQQALKQARNRIYGSKPGAYGAGLQAMIDEDLFDNRDDLANAYLEWGSYGYGEGFDGKKMLDDFSNQLSSVDAIVQNQDNREHDLLDSDDYYQFEGGLSSAVEQAKGTVPKAYHNDHSRPDRPVIRALNEEIGLIVRGRAANPKWISSIQKHGYKGAFEISATVNYLYGFAASTNAVSSQHFDALFEAYVVDQQVSIFMKDKNIDAWQEMCDLFKKALEKNLWNTRRNDVHAYLNMESDNVGER